MASGSLRVTWYDGWHPDVVRALAQLPEMETVPHGLLEQLLSTPTRAPKRAATVARDGEPVAVFGLVRRDRHWQPIGEIPDALGAGHAADLLPALKALGKYVRVWSWRGEVDERSVTHCERLPDYFAPVGTDWDALWRELHNTPHLNLSRNRLAKLGDVDLEVDGAQAPEWTVDQWAKRWESHHSDMDSMRADLLLTARHLQQRGRYHSFRLLHKGRPIAGSNWFAAGEMLVLHTIVFEPDYARYSPGVRLLELALRSAASSPYRAVGLGTGSGYKDRWMRQAGAAADFSVMPRHLELMQGARDLARSVIQRIRPGGDGVAPRSEDG